MATTQQIRVTLFDKVGVSMEVLAVKKALTVTNIS